MKTVLLDRNTLGDLDISSLKALLDDLTIFPITSSDQIVSRCKDAEIILTNKCRLDAEILGQLPKLKLIQLFASGTDNIDVAFAKSIGIEVKNVSHYSTESVSTYLLTTILNLFTSHPSYTKDVKDGKWLNAETFTFLTHPIETLTGKTLGIFGYGSIGKKIHEITSFLGMNVLIAKGTKESYEEPRLLLEDMLPLLDILIIMTPLTEQTKNRITIKELKMMKKSAYIINAARGGIVNEVDLAYALDEKIIAGAGMDVLSQEPPKPDHPLIKCPHQKLYLTPHIAWASKTSRETLLKKVVANIEHFIIQMNR
jgi:glycerate dehydrogenase